MTDDTRLTATDLLGELDWLGRLARSLVGGGADQDLVQQTWMAAARVEGGVSRPWLVGTLRRLAARWHRTESRLRRHEREAAKAEAVDTAPLLERSEMFSVVLEELRGMEEPFRMTLILLYQEGLSVREAASRLGVTEDTLRWRHRTGIERLRGRLDRGPRADWRACFLPLLGTPAGEIAPGALTASASGTPALLGGSIMTWKLLTAAAVAAIVIPLGLRALGDGPDGPATRAPRQGADRSEVDSVGLAAVESEQRSEAAADLEGDVADAAANGTGAPVSGAPGEALEVTLVDDGGALVPGARVWLGDSPDPSGEIWTADARGVARLPMPEGPSATVSASTSELYGQRTVTPRWTGGELRLILLPDADLTVVVVDGSGDPVEGVPVAVIRDKLRKKTPTDDERRIFGFKGQTLTDAMGVAVLRHANHRLRFERRSADWYVGPAVLLAQRSDVRIAYSELPVDPIRLVLPPVGSLDVSVRDARGELNSRAESVRLLIDPGAGSEREVPDLVDEARFSASGMLEVDLEGGLGRVPMIGLGLDLLAEAREAEPTGSTLGMGPGPDVAGEAAELVLEPRATAMEIVGHALDAGNRPLANQRLLAEVVLAKERMGYGARRVEVQTDDEGLFRVFVDEETRENWQDFEIRQLHLSTAPEDPARALLAERGLPAELVLGANDVGDVVLEPRNPLFSGAAVDGDGAPVSIEYLWLIGHSAIENRRTRMVLDVRTIVTGHRFAIHGSEIQLDAGLGESLRIQMTSPGRPGRLLSVTQGARDLTVVFGEGGRLTGRVILGAEQEADDYFAAFRTPEGPGDYRSHAPVELAHNGRFILEGLPVREGDLEVRDWATKTLLAVVPGVVPGETDARLESIALEADVEEFSLQVTDVDGEGIRTARFQSDRLPASHSSHGAGLFRWRAAGGVLPGVVSAPGFVSQEVTLTPGDRAISLRRGPEVVVRLDPAVSLPRGVRLTVLLVGGERYERRFMTRRQDGTYSCFTSGGGAYRLRGRLTKGSTLLGEFPLTGDPDAAISVSADGAGQTFDAAFDQAGFEAAWSGR